MNLTHHERELRIALAMRGGVSLAVWIGGAVAELELLRRAGLLHDTDAVARQAILADLDPAERERVDRYRTLLDERGYAGVRIDVLAGASAGGLNAVLYGVAQVCGLGYSWVDEVWRDEGSLELLMRGSWQPGTAFGVPSLLMGDDHFYPRIRDRLRQRIADVGAQQEEAYGGAVAAATAIGHRLTVDLSATLAYGPPASDERELPVDRPNAANFRFLHTRATPGSQLNDFPAPPRLRPTGERADPLLDRLAYAARTTSSFPGAFERATVLSRPQRPGSGAAPVPTMGEVPDLSGAFSEITAQATEDPVDGHRSLEVFKVLDGGIFDNIPVSRALSAIADAPASGLVDRALFYLDPSPPSTQTTENPSDTGEKWLTTLRRTFGLTRREERVQDEIELILKHNAAAAADRVGLDLIHQGIAGELAEAGEPLVQQYRRWRADLDCSRLLDQMLHPGEAYLRAMISGHSTDWVIDPEYADDLRAPLTEALILAYEMCHESDLLVRDAGALVLGCERMIFLAEAEISRRSDRAHGLDTTELGVHMGRLYSLRSIGLVAQQMADSLVVAALRELRVSAMRTPTAQEILLELRRILTETDPPAETRIPALLAAAVQAVHDQEHNGFEARLSELAGQPAALILPDLLGRCWQLLADYSEPLAPTGTSGTGPISHWLAALCLTLDAPSFRGPIQFTQLTANAPTISVLPDVAAERDRLAITALLQRQSELKRRELLTRRRSQRVGAGDREGYGRASAEVVSDFLLTPDPWARSKLAGNQLMNFAGFLSAAWRGHDWHWGRVDAATHICEVLNANEVRRREIEQSLAVEDLDRPKPRVHDLPVALRYGLAARIMQLVQRALWPYQPIPSTRASSRPGSPDTGRISVPRSLLSGVLYVARPVLVLLPLLAIRPLFSVGLLLALLVAHRVDGGSTTGGEWFGLVPSAVVIGSCIVALWRVATLSSAADDLRSQLLAHSQREPAPAEEERLTGLLEEVKRRLPRLQKCALVTLGVLVVCLLLAIADRLLTSVLATPEEIWSVAVALAVLPHLLIQRVPAAQSPAFWRRLAGRGWWRASAPLLALVAGLLVLGLGLLDGLGVGRLSLSTGLVTAGIVCAVQDFWTDKRWNVLSCLVSGVIVAWAVYADPLPLADHDLAARVGIYTVVVSSAVPIVLAVALFSLVSLLIRHLPLMSERTWVQPVFWVVALLTTAAGAFLAYWIVVPFWGLHAQLLAPLLIGAGAAGGATLLAPIRQPGTSARKVASVHVPRPGEADRTAATTDRNIDLRVRATSLRQEKETSSSGSPCD